MRRRLIMAAMLSWGLALTGCGQEDGQPTAASLEAASAPKGPDATQLANKADGSWIRLNGTVVSAGPRAFVLDHGLGNVTVEMDDWDWYQEGKLLKPGDRVVVSGRVDRDLLLKKRVEAGSVFVENLGTSFYASGADEEELEARAAYVGVPTGKVDFSGTVQAVEGREFTLEAAGLPIRVDTSLLPENPLDQVGFQKVKAGDRVYVWGDIDFDRGEQAELKARGLVSVRKDSRKTS